MLLRLGDPGLHRFHYTQLHMGVQVNMTVYAADQASAEQACTAAFDRIAQIDAMMSDYRPDSELMRLCDRAGQGPVPVSPELFLVLRRSVELSRASDGAFDVTVGPVVTLWRTARRTGVLPSASEIAAARSLVGWQRIKLDRNQRTVELAMPGIRLDLGGIAKGYALDCAMSVLRQNGIERALIEAGGDIVMSGPPPGTVGWRVQMQSAGAELVVPTGRRVPPLPMSHLAPEAAASSKTLPRILELHDCAVSTSGDTEQFVIFSGKRYSHIVDPKTGLGLTTRTEATVIAKDGITSDSLATAFCVLGADGAGETLRAFPSVRLFITEAN